MRHGSLFSGIGGFDLAAEWMGWQNIFHCEINKYCQNQLKKLFPNAKLHNDIKSTDFTIYKGFIDVLTGGDPCQPHSVAGLGKGKEDDRFLWPEFDRAASEIKPAWIVNENVSGTIANGVLDLKIDDLESKGYTCQAYNIPAEAVGALHQRERIWLVAHNPDFDRGSKTSIRIPETKGRQRLEAERNNIYKSRESVDLWLTDTDTDTDTERFKEFNFSAEPEIFTEGVSRYFGFGANAHGDIPRDIIESGIIRMLNGLPEGMDYTDRSKRIKALGNAIVPQVVYEIFKAIEQVV